MNNYNMTWTSYSHPLRIDEVTVPSANGRLGLTLCPGKRGEGAACQWERDLQADLAAIKAWPAAAVVTLLDQDEMRILRVADLGNRIIDSGLEWFHLGIADGAAPDFRFEQQWPDVVGDLLDFLVDGKNVLLHCRGGKGRTGTVGTLILIELGIPAARAIEMIRSARPGAIETSAQEEYIHNYAPRTR